MCNLFHRGAAVHGLPAPVYEHGQRNAGKSAALDAEAAS